MAKKTLQQEFNSWKQQNKLFGRQAFSRFMMLKFLEALQAVSSDEFIFKGGNLLWHYIKTPRATVDLDLVTQNLSSHDKVKEHLKNCAEYFKTVSFRLESFKELQKDDSHGAEVVVSFKTDSGQENKIHIDIVYVVPTDLGKVPSTFSDMSYIAASIENIIYDKVSTCYRFKSGNTRMKDFDDLYRISKSKIDIDRGKLKILMNNENLPYKLDDSWTQFMESHWKRHSSLYKDLPKDLKELFLKINNWLKELETA